MARKIRFSGFPQGQEVSLSASQGGVSRGPVTVSTWKSAPTSSVSASIARHPTGNVLPGEVITFYVTGTSGFTGSDEYEELDFEWDFGDSGATFSVAQDLPDTDANTDYGRVVAHAYTTTGAKTVTVTIRDHATGQVGTSTLSITVEDPDTIAWDHDLYVDFGEVSGTPDFTDAPAEGGAVQHISSITALQNVSITSADKARITFKKGETFTWNTSKVDTEGRTYIRSNDSFGSGDRPLIRSGGSAAGGTLEMFEAGNVGDVSRFAVYGVDFDGRYNPVTGLHAAYSATVVSSQDAPSGNLYQSFFRCAATGMRTFCSGDGTRTITGYERKFLGISDCDIQNWQNFGLASFGTQVTAGIAGVSMRQAPLALVRDDRESTVDEGADHGPIRLQPVERAGITKCAMTSTTGWTALGSDRAIQPCIRLHSQYREDTPGASGTDYPSLVLLNVQGNKGIGSSFATIGVNNTSDTGILPVHAVIVDRNDFTRTRQHAGALVKTKSATGFYLRNNIIYAADLYSDANRGFKIFEYNEATAPGYVTGADTGAYVFSFNTIVSDQSSASGDTDALEITDGTFQTTPVVENNLICVPNLANAGSITGGTEVAFSALSRGDNFKPLSATSSVVDAVSSGAIPVRDFDGNLRASTTNIGAHHDQVASATAVSAPSYTSGLTIAELAGYPEEYHVSDLGTWSNLSGDDRYLIEWQWQIDGTPTTYDWLTIHQGPGAAGTEAGAPDPTTGQLTCVITATNRSGVRESATSNAITLT